MKKTSLVANSFLLLGVSIILVNCRNVDNNKNKYLQKVLNNLNQIESATYYLTSESWAPGDTIASNISFHFIKEYNNPSDSTIGASFVSLLKEDTTHMSFCYDGKMRAIVYEEDKTIVLDSFKVRPLPFRPLTPPIFNYSKSIIKYALETKDSISTELKDFGDSLLFRLTIFEVKQVEFFGKAYYMGETPLNLGETTSKYEIWIKKSTDLPYRIRREMSHNTSVLTCRDVIFNKLKLKDFNAPDYFEPNYAIEAYGHGDKSIKTSNLVGKIAPNWILKDANNNTIALKDLKSKILMIQFTSVSCGPCRASIPFLKKLASEYDQKNFDFVAIESWTKNSNVLKSYQGRNNFSYKFLMSTKDVTKSYQIKLVPVFLILDKNRMVKKVIDGYGEGTTDKDIRDTINEMI